MRRSLLVWLAALLTACGTDSESSTPITGDAGSGGSQSGTGGAGSGGLGSGGGSGGSATSSGGSVGSGGTGGASNAGGTTSSGGTSGSGGTTNTGAFQGSCDTRTDPGPSQGQCRDWSGTSTIDYSVSCDGLGGNFSSGNPCPATNRVGRCTIGPTLGAYATYNYYSPDYTQSTAEDHCSTSLQGTFTAG